MNRMSSPPRLPNFVIIGAMKSATTTLQEQLVEQPGIFMCTPKEPNFFSDDEQYCRGISWYSSLFADAPDKSLLGEASTHYTKLPTYPDTVARIKENLSGVRFVYVMRHPIDRLVSHYIHEWSMGVYRCDLEEAIVKYPELVRYGCYAMQLGPYFSAFGRDQILPVFFDRLICEPQAELERVCRFIGYQGQPRWVQNLKPGNVSSERIRKFPLYNLLVESDLSTWFRRRFIPQGLRNSLKLKFRMQERPTPSDSSFTQLTVEFDRDLAQLGEWLGVNLDCKTFKQMTSSKSLDWVASNG